MTPNQRITTTKAAIYVRVSTTGQEEGASLETQEASCRTHAEKNGYEVLSVYREVYSGVELWDRPELTKLREAMRRKQFDLLICHAIDRLSRDPVHLGVILTEADHYGVSVNFVTEPLDNSPEGQLIRFVRGYAAKIEHEKIRERSLRGKRARVESGKIHNHGPELYGYRRDKDHGRREIYEPEAQIIRQIFEWSRQGRSYRNIAKTLNSHGIPSPFSGKVKRENLSGLWGRSTVYSILKNPTYKGETFAWTQRWNNRHPVTVDRSQWIHMPDSVTPSIIDKALWQLVNERLSLNKSNHTRNEQRPYLLRGLIFCRICGCKMQPILSKYYNVYRCSKEVRNFIPCGGKTVNARQIEEWVWDYFHRIARDPEMIIHFLEHQEPERDYTPDMDAAKRQLAKIETKMRNLIQLAANGSSVDMIQRELTVLEKERQNIKDMIAHIQGRIDQMRLKTLDREALKEYCYTLQAKVDNCSFEDKRQVIEEFGVKVYASGKDWELHADVELVSHYVTIYCAEQQHRPTLHLSFTTDYAATVASR